MKQYIEEHLTQPLSIDEMATHVHLSRSRVLHLFKEVYNITPYQYYSSLKMELAISLLARTPLSITEISDQLGFNGCSTSPAPSKNTTACPQPHTEGTANRFQKMLKRFEGSAANPIFGGRPFFFL